MQNTIKILVDLKKEIYRFDQAQQGDDVILDITLLENGVAKDLTGETVELIYINANNTIASVTGDKVVVSGNNVKITCPRDCTRSYGIAKFQLKIVSTYQVSTFPIALTIVPSVDQNQQISQNISTILEDLTAKNIECGETLDSLKAWISTGNLLNADLEGNIGTGTLLNTDLEDNITTVTQLKTVLTNVINTGNELDTSLEEKIGVGNTLDATLKADTEIANTAATNLQNVIDTADTTTYATQGQVTEINSQLADIVPRKTDNALAEILDNEQHDSQTGAIRVQVGTDSNLNALQTYNNSGTKVGGTHTNVDGKETEIRHHYNDKNLAQWDNVGRGNTILKLKQGRNLIMSKHDEVGSGKYLEFERDCSDLKTSQTITHDSGINRVVDLAIGDLVYDKFSYNIFKSLTTRTSVDLWLESYNDATKWSYVVGLGNETLGSIETTNLKSLGLSTTDEHVVGFWGKMGGRFKDFLFKSIYFFTKGNNDQYGQPAVTIYSLAKGGSCIKTKNIGTSKGASIHVENFSEELNSYGMRVDGRGTNAMYSGFNYNNAPYIFLQSMNDTLPTSFIVKDKNNNTLFQVSGDGKTIFMKDSENGTLRALRVTNGVLTIT